MQLSIVTLITQSILFLLYCRPDCSCFCWLLTVMASQKIKQKISANNVCTHCSCPECRRVIMCAIMVGGLSVRTTPPSCLPAENIECILLYVNTILCDTNKQRDHLKLCCVMHHCPALPGGLEVQSKRYAQHAINSSSHFYFQGERSNRYCDLTFMLTLFSG